MANHASQHITRSGIVPTYGVAANGDTIDAGDNVFVHVKNGGSGATVLTVTAEGGEGGLDLADLTCSIPVGEKVLGPFPAHLFKSPSDGKVHLAWSVLTSVTFAVLTL